MTADRWVIYATFDAEGRRAPFAEDQISAYRRLGFETLVVDTSPVLSAERRDAWDRLSTRWFERENTEYDFGSYRRGLGVLLDDMGIAGDTLDLVLTNDSCYGPYGPLSDVFDAFDSTARDGRHVFALTDSDEYDHHLQSFWLYFRSDVVHLLHGFFDALGPIDSRQAAIDEGELRLSRYLLSRGCTLTAFRSSADTVRHFATFNGPLLSFIELAVRWHRRRPRYTREGDKACIKALLRKPFTCNLTLAFGTHLHFQSMLPFVKRQLVRENPSADPFVPTTPPSDPRDNACIERWLRSTDRYRRRYRSPGRRSAG